jgi:hypothetical protein
MPAIWNLTAGEGINLDATGGTNTFRISTTGCQCGGQPRFAGVGPPGDIPNAKEGDIYLDAVNGDTYLYTKDHH